MEIIHSTAVGYSGYLWTILFNDISAREFESTDPAWIDIPDMGIHFEMSGTGCRKLTERLSSEKAWAQETIWLFLSDYGVNSSRIDIAYDDYNEMLDFEIFGRKKWNKAWSLLKWEVQSISRVGHNKNRKVCNEGNQKGVICTSETEVLWPSSGFTIKELEQLA